MEEKLEKNLLYLLCRHHIYELILRSVFEVTWPVKNSPDVQIFKRFRENWVKVDLSSFEVGVDDERVREAIGDKGDTILDFIENQFKVTIIVN